jgi:hypothetical protein
MPNQTSPSLENAEQLPPIDANGAVDAAFEQLAGAVAEATTEMLDSLLEDIGTR